MFSLHYHKLPRCSRYSTACDILQRVKRIQPSRDIERSYFLHGKSCRVVERIAGIAFAYKDTDVVTYDRFGRVDIDVTYGSVSTAGFASMLSPFDFNYSRSNEEMYVHIEGRTYAVRNVLHVEHGEVCGVTPMQQGRLNRKRFNAAAGDQLPLFQEAELMVSLLTPDSVRAFLESNPRMVIYPIMDRAARECWWYGPSVDRWRMLMTKHLRAQLKAHVLRAFALSRSGTGGWHELYDWKPLYKVPLRGTTFRYEPATCIRLEN